MKALKKLSAILLTLIMVLGLAVNAFAAQNSEDPSTSQDSATTVTPDAGPFTLTIAAGENNSTGLTEKHVYNVYQIYVCDIADVIKADGTTERIVSNIRYGNSGWGTKDAPVGEDELNSIGTTAATAEEFAKELVASKKLVTPYCTLGGDKGLSYENVPAGYYLIVDDTNQELKPGDSYSKYIVKVIDDVTVTPKSEQTSSDKVLYNDAAQEADVNDAGVGTVVSYKLTAKIAENADKYDKYYFILSDTMSEGLTFNDDITVTIGSKTGVLNTDYYLYKSNDRDENGNYKFEVAIANAKDYPDQTVVVNYSATLNSNAVAMDPETNSYHVDYSNNPEYKYDGTEDTENNPGKPLDETNVPLGQTPTDTTKTYTTELTLTKKADDANGPALSGATFKLTSTDANQVVMENRKYYVLDNKEGTWYLLKNGTYTKTAPADTSYEEIGYVDSKTAAGYIEVSANNYQVPEDGYAAHIGEKLYKKVLGNNSDYASTNKYRLETSDGLLSKPAPVEMILTTGTDGVLNFKGLGTGHYKLEEVDAPDGYNYAAPVEFDIVFNGSIFEVKNMKVGGEDSSDAITDNGSDGKFETTIVDLSGSTLPSTGGIGTTLFYVIGGILVAGAGVLLITKRRMNAVQ